MIFYTERHIFHRHCRPRFRRDLVRRWRLRTGSDGWCSTGRRRRAGAGGGFPSLSAPPSLDRVRVWMVGTVAAAGEPHNLSL